MLLTSHVSTNMGDCLLLETLLLHYSKKHAQYWVGIVSCKPAFADQANQPIKS